MTADVRVRALAVIAVVALASCRDGGAEEPRTTVPTAPDTSSSTTGTTAVSYEIPATIDAPYIEKVMAALDHVYGEGARYMASNRKVDGQFAEYLAAAFGGESFSLKQQLWGQIITDDFRLLRPEPGDAETTVKQVLIAEPTCVIFEAGRDFFPIFTEPDQPGPPRFVALVPLPPDRDVRHLNPTPWLITFDGRRSDGSEPGREEACTEP